MSAQKSRKIHQRSSSTGSGLLFGIGAAAGPHHVIHPQHQLLASQQLSSPSPDPLTSEDEESEDLDIKGKSKLKFTPSLTYVKESKVEFITPIIAKNKVGICDSLNVLNNLDRCI